MVFFVVFSSLSSNTSSLSSPAVSPQTGNSPVQKNGVLSDSTSTGKHETNMLNLRLLQWAWWNFPLLRLYTLCWYAGMEVSKACTVSICRVVQVTRQEVGDNTLLQIICTYTLLYMVSYPKRQISSKIK